MAVSTQRSSTVLPETVTRQKNTKASWFAKTNYQSYFLIVCLIVIFVAYLVVRYSGSLVIVGYPKPAVTRQASPNRLVRSFADDWLRLSKARVDWQTMLNVCVGNIAWGTRKSGFEKEMATSAQLSYIEATSIRPAGQFSKIFLRTRTGTGQIKSVGGDFWTVVFKGPSCVYAMVFDHGDGTYEAMAILMEPGTYKIEIFLLYTLCEGLKDPPDNWFRVGNAQGRNQPNGTLHDQSDRGFHYEELESSKKMSIDVLKPRDANKQSVNRFQNAACPSFKAFWNGFGRWVNNKWVPYVNSETDGDRKMTGLPNSFGQLWIFGDSLAVRFRASLSSNILCKKIFSSCKCSYNWIYPVVGGEQFALKQDDDFDFRPEIVLNLIRDVLQTPSMKRNDSLLVLNLGLHYTISINFTTYQSMIRDIIRMVKSRGEFGCRANVVWKTTTSIHKERSTLRGKDDPKRFFTPQRVELFEKFATSAMCEAGIEVLDIYHLSASYPDGTGNLDLVHYPNRVFHSAERALTRYVLNGFRSY